MNAVEIIEQLRAHKALVLLENNKLVVRGQGEPLPDHLQAALSEHKSEIMIALGAPFDRAVGSILRELRPNLPATLKNLPDQSLLGLVNWTIMHAWLKTIRNLEDENRKNPDSWRERSESWPTRT